MLCYYSPILLTFGHVGTLDRSFDVSMSNNLKNMKSNFDEATDSNRFELNLLRIEPFRRSIDIKGRVVVESRSTEKMKHMNNR